MQSSEEPEHVGPLSEHVGREPSDFEKRVHDVVRAIPAGRVASYGAVAKATGGSARAVGGAMRRNPFPPSSVSAELAVNWHRVVGGDRKLTGFGGHTEGPQLDRKRTLLESEGVRFDSKGRVALDSFLTEMPDVPSKKKTRVTRVTDIPQNNDALNDDAQNENARNDDDGQRLRATALEMLRQRGVAKTCWPSEIPRKLASKGLISKDSWRALMPKTHAVAKALAREGLAQISQKGNVLTGPALDHIKGPYRLRIVLPSSD